MVVGIIAGEHSGDVMGGNLIRQIQAIYPNTKFVGVGGKNMIQEGLISLHSMDILSIIGVVNAIKNLPKFYMLYKKLINAFLHEYKIDLFIGIDAPDFCLRVEKAIKEKGIKTIHYVSPTIWIWRAKRIYGIMKSCDAVLCIFPHEPDIYAKHDFPAFYVGHPLAQSIPMETSKFDARERLGIASDSEVVITFLPGSRNSELKFVGDILVRSSIEFARALSGKKVYLIIHALNDRVQKYLRTHLDDALSDCSSMIGKIEIVQGDVRDFIASADLVITKSGTISLECAMIKRPMVVINCIDIWNYRLVRLLNLHKTIRFIAMINHLAGRREVVPELLQDDATPKAIVSKGLELLSNKIAQEKQIKEFTAVHKKLLSEKVDIVDAIIKVVNM